MPDASSRGSSRRWRISNAATAARRGAGGSGFGPALVQRRRIALLALGHGLAQRRFDRPVFHDPAREASPQAAPVAGTHTCFVRFETLAIHRLPPILRRSHHRTPPPWATPSVGWPLSPRRKSALGAAAATMDRW